MAEEEDLIFEDASDDETFCAWLDTQNNLRENTETAVMVYSFLERLDQALLDRTTANEIQDTKETCLDMIFENIKELRG